ncbi:PREDICTED: G-type lectin S-receptor-like serine/threonine-protein kinase At4g03230 [Ipomoea nil]|uniref:G-type lectin S-receptor-like serine/threonine-protein kinase At4g03230 n=1 Tax=Ipomoea nil TaxID=35883 RepID=UPI000901FB4A|nr:PREDICTED: G-type lectin S-receptor-like serine/threonine-protein kinase At4g03230 [Ipomoea nil]
MQYICKLLCAFLMFMLPSCHGRDAITTGSSLLTEGDALVSAGKRFELGFFLDEEHSNCYVGIWYYKLNPQTIVWVANRESPIQDPEGAVVAIKEDGNLYVLNATGATCFSTQLDPTPSKSHRTARTARLLDSGNLVLIDNLSGKTLWQSFGHPADTFLPGMKMDESLTLTSWASSGYNPTPGNYTFIQDPGDKEQYIIYHRSVTYWKSGVGDQLTSLNTLPPAVSSLLSNFKTNDSSQPPYPNPRLLMNSNGKIQFYIWDSNKTSWSLQWSEPRNNCSSYNRCGKFGSCNNNNDVPCKCLPGFEPTNPDDWGANVFSGGCSRKSAISCNQNGKRDTFLNLTSVVIGNPDLAFSNAETEEDCKQECLNNCQCQAYSYSALDPTRRQRGTGDLRQECRIWTSDVIALQQDITNDLNISIRIAISDMGNNDKPPAEPTCSTSIDCEDLPNSICNATKQGLGRCLCKSGFKWDALSLNCTSVMTELGSSNKRTKSSVKFRSVIISISVFLAVVMLCSIGYIIYRRNLVRKRKDKRIVGNQLNNLANIGDQEDELTEDDKKAIDIPFFSLEIILAATDNFSDANKLGQGGFGPVYKGIFPGGQEIAVKRLLSQGGQGVNEFKNEIVLIAKLQHRNLVKLVGYCVTTNEKILLYEYMPNRSLDAIIFDSTLADMLDWKMRFDIILGIARGLLYLHQDSRLRIIHRDLKASNILLDQEMNPKISDFGLARIVEGKSIEANTNKVVGTLGYMPPEYALEGLFSIKSDVFSFGVVVLEIISGRKNTSFFQSQESLNLLGHAWKFWMEEKAVDMMDPVLVSSCNQSEVLRCINVGLLCVQEDPNDRPTMSNVVIMLATENMSVPPPKQPAFVARRRISETPSSSSSKITAESHNELTISMVGR